MKLSDLKPARGSVKRRKIVGRGPGSGHGKTSTRGHKGQKARTGGGVPPFFTGGQMRLYRLFPKRGFTHLKAHPFSVVNLRQLAIFPAGSVVGPEEMVKKGWVRRRDRVKVLGAGELKNGLAVRAHAFSASAAERIRSAGGTVEVL